MSLARLWKLAWTLASLKIVVCIVGCIGLLVIWNARWETVTPTDPPIDPYAIRAPLAALVAVLVTLFRLIPSDAESQAGDRALVLLGILSSAVTAWWWLMNATDGNPRPYLQFGGVVTALLSLVVVLLIAGFAIYALGFWMVWMAVSRLSRWIWKEVSRLTRWIWSKVR